MRQLTEWQRDQVAKPVTAPLYTVRVTLDYPERLSSREPVGVQSSNDYYESGRLVIQSLSTSRAVIKICNKDNRYTLSALNGVYQRRPIEIDWSYGVNESGQQWLPDDYESDYEEVAQESEPITVFKGSISAVVDVSDWVTIEARRSAYTKMPRLRLIGELSSHTAAAGSVIVFSGETYRIERRS